ncbi:hypothetical protein N7G274_005993 [Stereocaulon virgatum]|uniref:thioredoxin-dependent peroxiredoxin n=1 Tax=Stereocaulon virgatum TaxID=373712 RepID=A0ABR4A6C5_9LECA
MVELRKRKAAAEPAAPPPLKKASSVKSVSSTTSSKKGESSTNGSAPAIKASTGDTITLKGFGGDIETNDGVKVTLEKLVEESKSGVVIFTYPKASTPGCTTQACLFRDQFTDLTATGFSIFGLSRDSPKSNTTFKTKQNLPYVLLCDPKASLITAIGMKKAPSGTTRGVFVVNKEGRVEGASTGGPAATVDFVQKLIGVENAGAKDDVSKMAAGEIAEKAIEEGKTNGQAVEQAKTAGEDVAMADAPTAGIAKENEPKADQVKARNGGVTMTNNSSTDASKTGTADAEVAAEVADSAQKLDVGGEPTAVTATGDEAKADVAAEVADSAEKLDGGVQA